MKITMEFDCTPDEARQFLGLPDVKPLQAAVMAKMEKQMLEAADAYAPETMLKTWFSLLPQGQEQFQEMVGRFFRTGFSNGRRSGEP